MSLSKMSFQLFTPKEIKIPKKTMLYKYRIDLDLASMLWARKHIFSLSGSPWYIHWTLVTRLLVGQGLGARASGNTVKTQKLLHQLSLEPPSN